jgi:hypothetical protein
MAKRNQIEPFFDETRKRWKVNVPASMTPGKKKLRLWFKTRDLAREYIGKVSDESSPAIPAALAIDADKARAILEPWNLDLTQAARLQRDGWKLRRHETPSADDHVAIFEKVLPKGWVLEKSAHATIDSPVGYGCYYDTHRLLQPESGTILDHPEWEWAGLDRKRLVWVTKGVLYAAKIHGKGLGDAKALHDFNDMTFEAIPAPY